MSNGVIITAMICVTLIVLVLIGNKKKQGAAIWIFNSLIMLCSAGAR